MDIPLLITAVTVVLIIIALVRESAAPALVITAAMVLLLVTGVITPVEALSGFANPAPITVAALFIVARAVERTGALRPLLERALRPSASPRSNLTRLLSPVVFASAFLNNTPIVAMLIAPVTSWAERMGVAPSRFLMPISFAALLGGVVTLIGTSTNLVVSGLLVSAGYAPIGMFEMTPIGLPVAIAGLITVIITAPLVLPDRRGLKERFSDEFREFTIEMTVDTGGAVDGRSVNDAGLRHLQGVFLGWVRRGDRVLSPVSPDEVLHAGDRLGFVGGVDRVMDLQSMPGLRPAAHKHARGLDEGEHRFHEVVLAPISPLVGRTLRDAEFREQYQATVLAIHRSGDRVAGKLGDVVLEPGDTLLLLTDRGFTERWRDRRDFLLVSRLDGALPVGTKRAWFVLALTAALIIGAATEIVPILEGSLLASLILVGGRILTPNEARNAVDLDVILLIAASFGVGAAIESSGMAALVAGWIVSPAMLIGPVAVLAAVVIATLVLTELITNNAAAVLIFPISTAAAVQANVDPRAFAIAVAISASASFLTPIGYQTNTMVFGPGGYRFGDYVRLGAPLTLMVGLAVILLTAWRGGML